MCLMAKSAQDMRKILLRILTTEGSSEERIHQALTFLRESESEPIASATPPNSDNGLGAHSLARKNSGKSSGDGKSISKNNLMGIEK